MSADLAGRLRVQRHRRFVGRVAERDLFGCAIAAAEPPFNVLYVFGPGGVGKTTLLREFVYLCNQTDTPAGYLDGRNLEPSPDSFMSALCSAMGLDAQGSPFQDLASRPGCQVVLIDTYESLAPLHAWVNEVFLPRLPEQTLVVLASRNPPEPRWRADPGWQTLVRTLPLRNLSGEESRTYLARREVPSEQHQDILDFTHGHPLVLSLVADVFVQRRDVVRFQPEASPDVIKTLLEQLVQQVPGPAHRAALESCALVRQMTETLLVRMLEMPDAHELFEWLRNLAFVDSGPLGLFPHDVAREALVADLRWRNPDWYAELHQRARNYYAARLQQTVGREQQRVLFDYVFLHRDNPIIRPFFEWRETGAAAPDAMREGEGPVLEAMVAEHEKSESARLPEADFEVGGRRYGAYGHDWRVVPLAVWLDLLAQRETPARPLAASKPVETTPLAVLGEPEFAAAVRDALRNLHRPDALRDNPLLRSRMVVEHAGTGADETAKMLALKELLQEATESLKTSPREEKLHRALHRTYLHPAPTQERAAELLGLPFSTYRRHLKGGITRVGELLWQKEIGGSER